MALRKFHREPVIAVLSILMWGAAVAAPTNAAEQAVTATTFIDSIGINTRFNYTDTYYYTQWPLLSKLLVASGIRHIRDGGANMPQWYYDRINSLYTSSGIRNIGLCQNLSNLSSCVQEMITSMPGLEGFESLNEYNVSGDPNWIQTLRTYQSELYSAVKSNDLTRNLPVLGPSLANLPFQQAEDLGDLSASMDVGNLHNYPCGRNPGTPGWGGLYFGFNYGGIGYNLAAESLIAGQKHVWTTETGYDWGGTRGGDTPDGINARYIPRMYLEQFRQGIERTYIYQFSAQGPSAASGDGSGQLGLVDFNLKPKPAYYALKALISLLQDNESQFVPGTLQYTISGAASDVHHVLLEKSDHTFYLAIWIEAEGFDVNADTYETVPVQDVTLLLPNQVTSVTTFAFDDVGTLSKTKSNTVAGALTMSISDRVQIVQIP